MKKEDFQNAQQGTGSSEGRGNNRQTQKNPLTDVGEAQQKEIAHEAGLGRKRITDIEEMGGMSGKDDYAGSDSDNMSSESTDEGTDR